MMTSKGLFRFFSWMRLIGALALGSGFFGLSEGAGAKEFRFAAQELDKGKDVSEMEETEIWLPPTLVIDQKEDLNEPLWFVVQNPTGIDHEFAVEGLSMLVPEEEAIPEIKLDPESGGLLPRSIPVPLHIQVKAGETKKIQVAPAGWSVRKTWGFGISTFVPSIRISESAGSSMWTNRISRRYSALDPLHIGSFRPAAVAEHAGSCPHLLITYDFQDPFAPSLLSRAFPRCCYTTATLIA